MKRLFFLFAILIASPSVAQNLNIQNVDEPPRLENQCLDDKTERCFTISLSIQVNRNLDINKLLKAKATGTTYVQFTVNPEGRIINIRARSKSEQMAEAVTEAVRKIKIIEPAKKDGKPVEMSYTLPVKFQTKKL